MADVETIFQFSWRPSKLNNIHNYSFVCKYKKNKSPSKPRRKDLRLDLSVAGPETNGLIFLFSLLPSPESKHTHNPTCWKKQQNIVTMVPTIHRLPATPILQVSVIDSTKRTSHQWKHHTRKSEKEKIWLPPSTTGYLWNSVVNRKTAISSKMYLCVGISIISRMRPRPMYGFLAILLAPHWVMAACSMVLGP